MKKIIVLLFCLLQISLIWGNSLEIKPLNRIEYTVSNKITSINLIDSKTPNYLILDYKNKSKNLDITLDSSFKDSIVNVLIFNINESSIEDTINNYLENPNDSSFLNKSNDIYPISSLSSITKLKYNNPQKLQFLISENIEPFVILFFSLKHDELLISYATFYNLDLQDKYSVLNCEVNNKLLNFFCENNFNNKCNYLKKSCLIIWDLNLSKINLEFKPVVPSYITKTFKYVIINTNKSQPCNINDYPIVEGGLNYRCACVTYKKINYYGVEKCYNNNTVVYGPWSPNWDPSNINYEWIVKYPGILTKPCWKGEQKGCDVSQTWSVDILNEDFFN